MDWGLLSGQRDLSSVLWPPVWDGAFCLGWRLPVCARASYLSWGLLYFAFFCFILSYHYRYRVIEVTDLGYRVIAIEVADPDKRYRIIVIEVWVKLSSAHHW